VEIKSPIHGSGLGSAAGAANGRGVYWSDPAR
jgi:hypothetical protein